MKTPIILLTFLVLVFCGSTLAAQNGTSVTTPAMSIIVETKEPSIDSIVQYLLKSAATDFHTHRPPYPARFRNVHLSKIVNSENKEQYLLCGEFQTAQQKDKKEWIPFLTIKTSGYEQSIGSQALEFCKGSSVVRKEDLSPQLMKLLDSMK